MIVTMRVHGKIEAELRLSPNMGRWIQLTSHEDAPGYKGKTILAIWESDNPEEFFESAERYRLDLKAPAKMA